MAGAAEPMAHYAGSLEWGVTVAGRTVSIVRMLEIAMERAAVTKAAAAQEICGNQHSERQCDCNSAIGLYASTEKS